MGRITKQFINRGDVRPFGSVHQLSGMGSRQYSAFKSSTFLSNRPSKSDASSTIGGARTPASRNQALRELGIMNDRIHSQPRHYRKRPRASSRARHMSAESTSVRVKSVHAAQTLDVVNVLSKVFGAASAMPPVRHMFGKTSVIVQLAPADSTVSEVPRFVAVYRFGSVVFFNMSPRDAGKLLESIKKHGTGAVSSGFERKEHFEVLAQPNFQEMPHVASGDFCVVQTLDMNATAVISNIMAQTVALDSYSDTVDQLLANFASINSTVTQTGTFSQMERSNLFRVVSQNNSIFIDMISKLGIKDRSDTAWNLSQYEQVHEGMREEFEIDSRFQNIEFKLNLIQQNAKFFLEMLNDQKGNTLEWVIIVLITFECVLMIMEMSGAGDLVFANTLKQILPPK